ncbi:MAG TPA: hypothetical protein VNQ73_20905 [Ilumatobacter sp.]|nr:hypothetical protein [Ilumatobacter sp.]
MNVTIKADVQSIDETGYVWTYLSDASEPERIAAGAVVIAGDDDGPVMARVVDIVAGPGNDQIVHLTVLGIPDEFIDELRRAGAIASS